MSGTIGAYLDRVAESFRAAQIPAAGIASFKELTLTAIASESAAASAADHAAAAPGEREISADVRLTIELAVVKIAGILQDEGNVEQARAIVIASLERGPRTADALILLGRMVARVASLADAAQLFHEALALEPDNLSAWYNLAVVSERLGRVDEAENAWRRACPNGAFSSESEPEGTGKPKLLMLGSILSGNLRFGQFLTPRDCEIITFFAESFHAGVPVPACDAVMLAVGEADLCARALQKAQAMIELLPEISVLNRPVAVVATGREVISRRLAVIDGVRTARTLSFAREHLCTASGSQILSENGFSFPCLLRSPGFHVGRNFEYVESPEALLDIARSLPGDALLAIEFFNPVKTDGTYRKYRVMSIGGRLYPLHLAISHSWKVHYFTSDMNDDAAFRAEEEAFLTDMPAVLGAPAVQALEQIFAVLGLDYAGIDFALDAERRILVYEANATMVILEPDSDPRWAYRKPAIDAARNAARAMVQEACGRG